MDVLDPTGVEEGFNYLYIRFCHDGGRCLQRPAITHSSSDPPSKCRRQPSDPVPSEIVSSRQRHIREYGSRLHPGFLEKKIINNRTSRNINTAPTMPFRSTLFERYF